MPVPDALIKITDHSSPVQANEGVRFFRGLLFAIAMGSLAWLLLAWWIIR